MKLLDLPCQLTPSQKSSTCFVPRVTLPLRSLCPCGHPVSLVTLSPRSPRPSGHSVPPVTLSLQSPCPSGHPVPLVTLSLCSGHSIPLVSHLTWKAESHPTSLCKLTEGFIRGEA